MSVSKPRDLRVSLLLTSALCASAIAGAAHGAEAAAVASEAAAEVDAPTSVSELVITNSKTTRSAVALGGEETQKILPGVNPLKAIQTLPGVLFVTADPWGNNEQNEALYVHGFAKEQLGYTMDGVPLGDQSYGNYNGLSVSRAVISENVDKVVLSSGAGALGVASSSNLGGAIETFSREPSKARTFDVRQTVGSYDTTRSFLRFDTGEFGAGNTAYVSYLHHDARAWDFNGHQRDDQANAKFVHDDAAGKLTAYVDWQTKVEPNEDSVNRGAGAVYQPYARPFLYPDLKTGLAYLDATGAPPAVYGNNFSNYHSAAQREDLLGYVKYDWRLNDAMTWSNQVYYHYDYGRGIVAGPVNQAGLPGLFTTYFPGRNLIQVFGGTGYEVRTTEYRINRSGGVSNLNWQLGDHAIEAGVWIEHNESATHRVWYPFSAANSDLTPYDTPRGQAFTQYYSTIFNNTVQFHLQDQWRIRPDLLLQAGFKSSLQYVKGSFPIPQKTAPGANPAIVTPSGHVDTEEWFLPQVGGVWDATDHEQVFFNIQKNMRQFVTYGAGGLSPWSLGSQAAFDQFKQTANPETAWTYELGARTHRDLDLGPLTSIQGQVSLYHVNFSDRLLQVAAFNFINPGASVLANVGSVKTDGVDVAATFNFGEHVHLYDALSYNRSTYGSNYSVAQKVGGVLTDVVVHTSGKWVPATPDWLNKSILSVNAGAFEAQLSGDYVGRRYATYLNDLSVKASLLWGLEASYQLDAPSAAPWVRSARVSVNVTNLTDEKGVSTLQVTGASGGYATYPIPPRMVFVTLSGTF
jgi:iron complex outermembrane receptor protein